MEIWSVLTGTVAAVAVLLLIVAAGHKFRLVHAGEAASVPLVSISPLRMRFAAQVLTAAALAELLLAVLTLLSPLVGLAAFSVLVGCYGLALLRVGPEAGCGCFGGLTGDMTARVAAKRNAVIAVVAAAAAGLGFAGLATPDALASGPLVLALVAVSGFGAWRLQTRLSDGPSAYPVPQQRRG